MKTMQEWWKMICDSGAVWQHSGDFRSPHVVLRSGKHSDGFIDTLQFLCKVRNLQSVATALAKELNIAIGHTEIDWVFGSPMAGVPIATTVAPLVGSKNIGFTEKKGDKDLLCRFDVAPGETVLLIEEMTTTGGTPQRGIDAILAKNPQSQILPFVGAFLIRCDTHPPELRSGALLPIINLRNIGVFFNEWSPEACPLCERDSRAITNCKQVWEDLLITMREPKHPVG